jgi:hypothetical protein
MTIPTHIPNTICPWCGSKGQIENPDHPKAGRYLLESCSECNYLREHDRGEKYEPDSEDLDPN